MQPVRNTLLPIILTLLGVVLIAFGIFGFLRYSDSGSHRLGVLFLVSGAVAGGFGLGIFLKARK